MHTHACTILAYARAGFLSEFITPIVKCTKANKELSFFTIPEYEAWKAAHKDGKVRATSRACVRAEECVPDMHAFCSTDGVMTNMPTNSPRLCWLFCCADAACVRARMHAACMHTQGYRIKYYKGLGTSTAAEAKRYFSAMNKHHIDFAFRSEQCTKQIELAFSKTAADARKDWMRAFVPGTIHLTRNTNEMHQ
jgi:DNA gyrase/topoisomerase IV subunit B